MRASRRAGPGIVALVGLAGAFVGCVSVSDQARERGEQNVLGRWRVVRSISAEPSAVSGEWTFGASGILYERTRVFEVGPGQAARERDGHARVRPLERDRRYKVKLGAEPGAYELVIDRRLRAPLTFTTRGRMLVVLPAEAGNGWASGPVKLELERVADGASAAPAAPAGGS